MSAFWTIKSYAPNVDGSKGSLLSTITEAENVSENRQLSAAQTFSADLFLTDPNTAALAKAQFVEIFAGRTSPQTLWASGYAQKVTIDTATNLVSIDLADALIYLARYRIPNPLEMTFGGGYLSVIAFLMGRPMADGSRPPGRKGILPPGWNVVWKDDVNHTNAPGAGDSWYGALQTAGEALATLGGNYNFGYRLQPGKSHTFASATLEIGVFGDPSGLTAWGGKSLLTEQQNAHPQLTQPNVAFAQEHGKAVVSNVHYEDDLSNLKNIVWVLGRGTGVNQLSLGAWFGNVTQSDGVTAATGVTRRQFSSGGDYYYFGPQKAHWTGNTYQLVARQDNDGSWMFGVANITSVNALGPLEDEYTDHKAKDDYQLLASGLGRCDWVSTWVRQFTLDVLHPRTSPDGVPQIVQPGQTIDVRYASMAVNNSGQPALSFPGTTDANEIAKLKRCAGMVGQFTPGGYNATYTMGRGKQRPKRYEFHLADQIVAGHSWHEIDYAHIHWWCSEADSTGLGTAREDRVNARLELQPGSIVVSNVKHDRFFGPHKSVEFDVTITDGYLDVWFAKPYDGSLKGISTGNANKPYAFLRLAMQGSGKKSGFYTTWDGTPATTHFKGALTKSPLLDRHGRVINPVPGVSFTCRVHLLWSGGIYEAHVSYVGGSDGSQNHDIFARWTDKLKAITTYGAFGWHAVGGTQNVYISKFHAITKRKKARHSHGGKGKRQVSIHDAGGGGGHIYAELDENAGTLQTKTLIHHTGVHHGADAVAFGPFHPTTATVASTSISSGMTTVVLQGQPIGAAPLTDGGLEHGWTVQVADANGAGDSYSVHVDSVNLAADAHTITSFTSSTPEAQNIQAGNALLWDPIEENPGAHGHVLSGQYNAPRYVGDKRAGHAAKLKPASAKPGDEFQVHPSKELSIGSSFITDENGQVINHAPETVSLATVVAGSETHGALILDTDEYESVSAQFQTYAPNTGPFGPGASNYYGGGASPAYWAPTTPDNTPGMADQVLGLVGATAGETVRFWDTQIVESDGHQRTLKINHNGTLEYLVYVGSTGNTAVRLGASTTISSIATVSGKSVVTVPIDVAKLGAAPGDVWVLSDGTANAETLTIDAGWAATAGTYTVTFSTTAANSHSASDRLVQKASSSGATLNGSILSTDTTITVSNPLKLPASGNYPIQIESEELLVTAGQGTASLTVSRHYNGTTAASHTSGLPVLVPVQSTGTLDGTHTMGDLPSAIDRIAVGLLDTNGNWYRGYWGKDGWTPPYGTANHIGRLSTTAGSWTSLHVKPGKLLTSGGTPLWKTGQAPITIVGFELATHSLNGGVTVCFDACGQGFVAHRDRTTPVPGGKLPPGTVKQTAPSVWTPSHHTHSDLRHFLGKDGSGNWRSYWTNGWVTAHDGGNTFDLTINGTTEDAPTNGVYAVPIDNSAYPGSAYRSTTDVNKALGNFLVLNTTGTAFFLWDPNRDGSGTAGTVFVPAYSASGGPSGQSTGFAIVSDKFNWKMRTGGAIDGGTGLHIYRGPPNGLINVGKIDRTVDVYTGNPVIKGISGTGKTKGTDVLEGSLPPVAHTKQLPHRGAFVGGKFRVRHDPGPQGGHYLVALLHDHSTDFAYAYDDGSAIQSICLGPTPAMGNTPDMRVQLLGNGSINGLPLPPTIAGEIVTWSLVVPPTPSAAAVNTGVNQIDLPIDTYYLRWCWVYSVNGQNIESALSPEQAIVVPFGKVLQIATPTSAPVIAGKPTPSVSGIRVYASRNGTTPGGSGAETDQSLVAAVNTTVYLAGAGSTASGTTVFSTGGNRPSYGFFAWPSSTKVAAHAFGSLMKAGHFDTKQDPIHHKYTFIAAHPLAAETPARALADQSVTRTTQHPQSVERFQFLGGTFTVSANPSNAPTDSNPALIFTPTDNTNSGQLVYHLDDANSTQSLIPLSAGGPASLLSAGVTINGFGSPYANDYVLFCHLPTGNISPSLVPGSFTNPGTFYVRAALTKGIPGTANFIETMPSPPMGSPFVQDGAHAMQFTITAPDGTDSSWTPVVYVGTITQSLFLQPGAGVVSSYNATTNQWTVTLSSYTTGGLFSSCGFTSVPAGTDLTADFYVTTCTKVGHIGPKRDAITGLYTLHGHLTGSNATNGTQYMSFSVPSGSLSTQTAVAGPQETIWTPGWTVDTNWHRRDYAGAVQQAQGSTTGGAYHPINPFGFNEMLEWSAWDDVAGAWTAWKRLHVYQGDLSGQAITTLPGVQVTPGQSGGFDLYTPSGHQRYYVMRCDLYPTDSSADVSYGYGTDDVTKQAGIRFRVTFGSK